MYEDRPKNSPPIRDLISNLEKVGLLSENMGYVGLDVVHYYTKIPYEEIVGAILNNELQNIRIGGIADDGEEPFPLTLWEWVDKWIESKK